jgi:DNA adenine methylase
MNKDQSDMMAIFNQLDDSQAKSRDQYLRLPFAWPGNKFASLDKILPHLPYRRGFCEPFGGSGVILLNRQPSKQEIYNDRYGGLVAMMRVLRDPILVDRFVKRLSLTLHSREEWVWSAESWNGEGTSNDDVERAARWYYMIRCSFGHLGRNFGRSKTNDIPKKFFNGLPDFYPVHRRLRHVLIENLDWKQCMKDYDAEDMVFYLDPPYLDSEDGTYATKFRYQDHVDLLHTIFTMKGYIVLSGYPNSLYDSSQWTWDSVFEWDQDVRLNLKDNDLIGGRRTEKLWVKK